MGTRHRQIVINKEGKVKVDQYGQWDGYPEGQGIEILKFLKNSNLEQYEKKVSNLKKLNKKICDRINKEIQPILDEKLDPGLERFKLRENEEYYALSRDCGSDIHNLILYDKIKYVDFCGKEGASWCEGFYTIDFNKNEFKVEYYDIIKIYKLNNLPDEKQFLKDFKK